MKLALNYSHHAAALLAAQAIEIDLFKIPPWPDQVAAAERLRPVYVHFPLSVGSGRGDAVSRKGQEVDWQEVERWLAQTSTPFVNLHLTPDVRDYPGRAFDDLSPDHVAEVTARLISDVAVVVARFGPERVIVENVHGYSRAEMQAAILPQVIAAVVAATGCGLLFDLSHARLAAGLLGMDLAAYTAALPLHRLRELHLTGIQPLNGERSRRIAAAGVDADTLARLSHRPLDHMPLTQADWPVMAWARGQIAAAAWAKPAIVAIECGGVGELWGNLTDPETLAAQVPPLRRLFSAEGR